MTADQWDAIERADTAISDAIDVRTWSLALVDAYESAGHGELRRSAWDSIKIAAQHMGPASKFAPKRYSLATSQRSTPAVEKRTSSTRSRRFGAWGSWDRCSLICRLVLRGVEGIETRCDARGRAG